MPRDATRRAWDALLALVFVLFATGWGWAVAETAEAGPPRLGARLTAADAGTAPPAAAFALDALLKELGRNPGLRGASGAVRVVVPEPGAGIGLPDSLPADVHLEYDPHVDRPRPAVDDGHGLEIGDARSGHAWPADSSVAARADSSPAAPADSSPARPADRADAEAARPAPGVWDLLLRAGDELRRIPDLTVLSPVPLTERVAGRIGRYVVGEWPYESGTPPDPAYAPPRGLVRVTPENRDLRVSQHLRLGDFLTKGQADVWPKYVALSPRLLDKLELTIQELERTGHPVSNLEVLSGFRTPTYNRMGGDPSGRASLSRHMYGDGADVFVDDDGDGRMDDLDGNGRIDLGDARVLAAAAERVEEAHPGLVGGIGTYGPTDAHGGFVHIDTRGYRARW